VTPVQAGVAEVAAEIDDAPDLIVGEIAVVDASEKYLEDGVEIVIWERTN
jgi:hypothetical protein